MQLILEQLGFCGEARDGRHFKHESIRVDRLDFIAWGRQLEHALTLAGPA